MNVLAHALVAGRTPDLQVGGVLGDFVRGRPDEAWPPGLRAGVVLHRAVDGFTDTHPQVVDARRRFAAPWRRYAGIMLDVWFDHLLARDFARYSEMPLDAVSLRLHAHLRDRWAYLPPRLRIFTQYMQRHDLPAAYAEPEMIVQVLAGLSQRLKRRNPLADAFAVLAADEVALQRHFEAFFPDLQAFAARWRADLPGPAAGERQDSP